MATHVPVYRGWKSAVLQCSVHAVMGRSWTVVELLELSYSNPAEMWWMQQLYGAASAPCAKRIWYMLFCVSWHPANSFKALNETQSSTDPNQQHSITLLNPPMDSWQKGHSTLYADCLMQNNDQKLLSTRILTVHTHNSAQSQHITCKALTPHHNEKTPLSQTMNHEYEQSNDQKRRCSTQSQTKVETRTIKVICTIMIITVICLFHNVIALFTIDFKHSLRTVCARTVYWFH